MLKRCPGQDKRNIEAEAVRCRDCGYEIEIFSDEAKAACPKCKRVVWKENLASCIGWCKYAKECVGEDAYHKYKNDQTEAIKEKLLKELEEYFGADIKRINHARKVMGYAEELLRSEGGDWHIVMPASILHDVGIKAAEEKYHSAAGHLQEKEGPAIARKILLKLGFNLDEIAEICEMIAHHHSPGHMRTLNFKLLCDADWLVNLKGEANLSDKIKSAELIGKVLATKSAKEIAQKLYL